MNSMPSSADVTTSCTLRRGLADVARHEPAAIGLDEVALGERAQHRVDAREQAGDGRLAGAGVADEHEMAAALGDREAVLAP